MIQEEKWVPIEGFEGSYEVSSYGHVRSLDRRITSNGAERLVRGRTMRQTTDRAGYRVLTLWRNGEAFKTRVHRLVAKAFVPGEAPGMMVCHNDGDPANNSYTNLRWDTAKSNVADMARHGTNYFANRTHCPKGHEYSPANVIVSQGRRFCRACRNAFRRRRRAEVSVPRRERDERDGVIVAMDRAGKTQMEIAEAVGFTQAGVSTALRRIRRASQSVPYDEDSDD